MSRTAALQLLKSLFRGDAQVQQNQVVTNALFYLAGGPRSTVLGESGAAFLCDGLFRDL